ncbi:glycine betaine ABC transporter substrate-binding protein [Oceanihabitans sp. IOP_32]|uniref:glycine betaine ABC transporter substrate-binding protein n=1 Tax=Oceanihabitans sp. IOP_32 TaxID=2529032 RepID=UPI0012935957|nr:glycine betaine ABC transporter substrate-binding protein [Oceanihabitans sp. IOP_32]QFZ53351.1 glycine betaine ABC transporter substrate-binding protein [Oceanihabitans sp. IOP_32]
MKLKFIAILVIMTTLFATGCKSDQKTNNKENKTLEIAYVDGWAEGVAMTHVATEIMKEKGYDVELKKAAVDLVFASLANGDLDVFMDAWLPATHKEKVAKFGDKIESLGVNFDNAKIGLVVPKYVTINSIEELNAHAEKFDGQIVGIEKGAGITKKTDIAVEDYNLDLNHLNSSSIAMLSELQKAIQENRWIVVTGWAPHWKFGRFELKFLEDPKNIYGGAERIETYARKGFKTDDAFANKFFANFHLNESQMADLLVKMEEKGDKSALAKQWIAANQELVNSWLK